MIFAVYNFLNITRLIGGTHAIVNKVAEANAAKRFDDIREVIGYYLKITLASGLVVGVLGFVFGPHLARLIYDKELVSIAIRLVFLSPLLNTFGAVALAVLMGFRQMRHCTALNVGQPLVRLALIALFLLLGWGVTGVVVAHILSALAASGLGIILLERVRRRGDVNLPGMSEMLSSMLHSPIWKYTWFVLPVSLNKHATAVFAQVPVFLLGRFVEGNRAAGYFNLGLHIVTALWSGFLGLSKNLLPYLSEFKGRNDIRMLKDRFFKVTLLGGFTGLLFGVAFTLMMPYVIIFVYGEAWRPVTPLIYVLMVQYVFLSFGIAANIFYIVAGRVWFAFGVRMIFLAISFPFAILLVKSMEHIGAAIYYSGLVSTLSAVYLIDITYRMKKLPGEYSSQ
jgi:O-antigen/teichoic acid export membrane protein